MHASSPCSALRPELGAVYQLLKGLAPHASNVCVNGTPEEIDATWSEIWESIEMIRVLAEGPEAWEAHFTTGLASMLTTRERLALPGVMDQLLWTGGDSTLERLGAADWEAKLYGVVEVSKASAALKRVAGASEDSPNVTIIAIGELLCLLVLAAARGPAWAGW